MSKIAIIGLSGESIFLKLNTLPMPSVTSHATSCHIEPGGKGYNQAVACKKNGSDVTYLSKVGNDTYGIYCKEYMDKLGINTTFLKDHKKKTAVATILTDNEGENEVIVYPGASELLSEEDIHLFEQEIKNSDILLVQNEIPYKALTQAIKIAKQNNVLVVLNPAPAKYNDDFLLKQADIITPNLEEFKAIYDIDKNTEFSKIFEKIKNNLTNILIVTMGSHGCALIKDGDVEFFEAYNVNAIDTTGAGDTFNAGLVSMLNKDLSNLKEAIEYAIAASALSVTKPFVMDSIPTYEEVIKFIQRYKGM